MFESVQTCAQTHMCYCKSKSSIYSVCVVKPTKIATIIKAEILVYFEYCESGIDEGDHDVSGPLRDPQSFVQVSQSPRMHQGPAFPHVADGAIVSMESASSSLRKRTTVNRWKE